MMRFAAERFAADLRIVLRNAPRGTRTQVETIVSRTSLQRLTDGKVHNIDLIASVAAYLGMSLPHYLDPVRA